MISALRRRLSLPFAASYRRGVPRQGLLRTALETLVLTAPVGLVSILAFVGLEKPCMHLARGVAARRRPPPSLRGS
jgi:hypothetical protein